MHSIQKIDDIRGTTMCMRCKLDFNHDQCVLNILVRFRTVCTVYESFQCLIVVDGYEFQVVKKVLLTFKH